MVEVCAIAGLLIAVVILGILGFVDPRDVVSTAERRFGDIGLLVGVVFWGVCLLLAVLLVCIPGCVADDRKHHNRQAIWAASILFGWTFLGWGIALVWALTNPPTASPPRKNPSDR